VTIGLNRIIGTAVDEDVLNPQRPLVLMLWNSREFKPIGLVPGYVAITSFDQFPYV